MSGRYAEFVETEVLPLVERRYDVKLTKDPEGRATMGGSSGGSAAFIPNVMRDGIHDWVVASENMARVLAAKGYHYQFVFARNAGHVDRGVKQQTLPEALEWLWKGYAVEGSKSAR